MLQICIHNRHKPALRCSESELYGAAEASRARLLGSMMYANRQRRVASLSLDHRGRLIAAVVDENDLRVYARECRAQRLEQRRYAIGFVPRRNHHRQLMPREVESVESCVLGLAETRGQERLEILLP
jgi:hypothetical protein